MTAATNGIGGACPPPSADELREIAQMYHERKLPITLCPPTSKKPLGEGWTASYHGRGWQLKKWSVREINQAFDVYGALNLGCLWGSTSKMIDVEEDSPTAKQDFIQLFEDCEPPVTPTFQSRRGAHRMYAWDSRLNAVGKATIHYNGLEIKLGANGKGSQSLLPPSTTDGFTRRWLVSLDDCNPMPLPNLVIQRIIAGAAGQRRAVTHREHKTCPESSVCSGSAVSSVCQSSADWPSILAAIELTLPDGRGQRHRQVFAFARQLKAMPQYVDADVLALKEIVRAWHQSALPFIGTKPFEDTWYDFAESWPKIIYVAGKEPIHMAYEEALAAGIPTVARNYEQEPLRLLIALCRTLQQNAGDKPFYLAGRVAATLLTVPHTQVARWLRLLVIDRVLIRTTIGTRNHASEYWYRGGPA